MRVMFVSQCSKKALIETRRILDQFAERKGDCVWQTEITEAGLTTVRKLLRASARKNTAIACHLFRGRSQTELLWVIGNRNSFNFEGSVPTNITKKDILRADDENDWNFGEAIAIASAIAGLFHDFGKATKRFQDKLKGKASQPYEPFRHEWISLILFRNFVKDTDNRYFEDREWLEKLGAVSPDDEKRVVDTFPSDVSGLRKNPFYGMPPFAQLVGWLILSHHRIPTPQTKEKEDELRAGEVDRWMSNTLNASWNSIKCEIKKWERASDFNKAIDEIKLFPYGIPFKSSKWTFHARRASREALRIYPKLEENWFQDRFSVHLMRLALMLSDHSYSRGASKIEFQDAKYKAYANSDKGKLKQKLDEHNVGVATNAYRIAKKFPKLKKSLPSISYNKRFKQRSKNPFFSWQDKAFDVASSIKNESNERGFFGVNLASTGCGKTLANARFMYGLSDERLGCRFSIVLGLRVLTLQTGDALQEKLGLDSDDVAVLIGSKAFQRLHEIKEDDSKENISGSESSEDLCDNDYVRYDGTLEDGLLGEWLDKSPKLRTILSAPILVSTIDYLMPATEGCRGGKQIIPILRLLTSDLVIDEPDDFDVTDLPALCRLVNFAGVMGSRVLISSATLPPSFVEALFEAYSKGRQIFNRACRKPETSSEICCAWVDEFNAVSGDHLSLESFKSAHKDFVELRIRNLQKQPVLRRASVLPMVKASKEMAKQELAHSIEHGIYDLHKKHFQTHPQSGKQISFGLVRMANIDPLVAVSKLLLSKDARDDFRIHFCIYHSKFPLIIRSNTEQVLDRVLARHDKDRVWGLDDVALPLQRYPEKNHLFVVFATSVAEVGRDHDYDWAVVEPSSMRSIIQLAGRVQRHRKVPPANPNILILEYNLKGVSGENRAFIRPGYESIRKEETFHLNSKSIKEILLPGQYEQLSSIPRLIESETLNYQDSLVDLEHKRTRDRLFGGESDSWNASLWWSKEIHWCGVLQSKLPFRMRQGTADYFFKMEERGDKAEIYRFDEKGEVSRIGSRLFEENEDASKNLGRGVSPWIVGSLEDRIEELSAKLNQSVEETSTQFTSFSLRDDDQSCREKWMYDFLFGFYKN